jgi:hypothetical protein
LFLQIQLEIFRIATFQIRPIDLKDGV